MDRFLYGFATLFAFAFGMFHEGRGEDSTSGKVTNTSKAQIEYD